GRVLPNFVFPRRREHRRTGRAGTRETIDPRRRPLARAFAKGPVTALETLRPAVNVVPISHGHRTNGAPHGSYFESGELCLRGQVRRARAAAEARGYEPGRGGSTAPGRGGGPPLVRAGTTLVPRPVEAGGRLVQHRRVRPLPGAPRRRRPRAVLASA